MLTICLIFHVHQPFRLKTLGLSDIGRIRDPFDHDLNERIIRRAAQVCYRPVNAALTRLADRGDSLRFSISITGTAVEQLGMFAPDALKSFKDLVDTGAVGILGETYFHSLSSQFDAEEFREQVRLHLGMIDDVFGRTPTAFRNTELIYDDRVADLLIPFPNFTSLVTEGSDPAGRNAGESSCLSSTGRLVLFLRNYVLSDDIAFRFRQPDGSALTAEAFAGRLKKLDGPDDPVLVLYVDYETFGEHHKPDSGIVEFLLDLIAKIAESDDMEFGRPDNLSVSRRSSCVPVSFPRPVSWADTGKDLTAWLGNALQENSARTLYDVLRWARESDSASLLTTARRLSSSDHLMYLGTKDDANGAVHRYFSPYISPEAAYRNFLFALADLEENLK